MSGEGPGNGLGIDANVQTISAHRVRAEPVREPEEFSRAFGDRVYPKIIRALDGPDLLTKQQALKLLLELCVNPQELEKALQQERLLPLLLKTLRTDDPVSERTASEVLLRICGSFSGRGALEKQAIFFELISSWIEAKQPIVATNLLDIAKCLWKLPNGREQLANEDFVFAVSTSAHSAYDSNLQACALKMLGEIVATRDCQQLALEVEAVSKCVDVLRQGVDVLRRCVEDSAPEDDVEACFTRLSPRDLVLTNAALCLARASEAAVWRDIALSEGAIETLVKLLLVPESASSPKSPSREARQHTLYALKFLGLDNQAKLTLVDVGGVELIETLLATASNSNFKVFASRLHAIQVMSMMSEHPNGRKMLRDSHSLPYSAKYTNPVAALEELRKDVVDEVDLTKKQTEVFRAVAKTAIDVISWNP